MAARRPAGLLLISAIGLSWPRRSALSTPCFRAAWQPPLPCLDSRQLRVRGGEISSGSSAVAVFGTERAKQQAYYDVDGTLYDGTMAHCGWWFICALPSVYQRLSKAAQFCVALPYVGALAAVDEARAASCLGRLLVRGVRVSDALCAAEAVADGVLWHAYPEVIDLLLQQQREGHETILLSGNIEPLLSAIGARLNCGVIGTKMEVAGGRYTGNIVGPVCVLEGKRQKLLESMHPSQRARAAAERSGLAGVGNSVYDVPFLCEVPKAWVVRPSSRLRRIAEGKGWDLTLVRVKGSGVSRKSVKPKAKRFQV